MTAPAPRAWSVTLSFAPPGPLYTTLILAHNQDVAVALATFALMRDTPTDAPLQTVLASEIPAETLRQMLRAVEGKLPASGSAEIMRLVPAGQTDWKRQFEEQLIRSARLQSASPQDDDPAA